MDLVERILDQGYGLSSPLGALVCWVCVTLGAFYLQLLRMQRTQRALGPNCRPDEPLQGTLPEAKITSLRVYPIKSCAGHEVQEATLGDRGLEMDRLWMVVDGAGRFLTQRRCAKMALISPTLPRTKDEPLILSAPGMAPLEVPVVHKVGPDGPHAGGEMLRVEVWSDTCQAIDQGSAATTWLGDFLEMDGLRLVRMQDGFERPTNPAYGKGFRTGFADGFPMLLAAEESLEELNSRIVMAGGKAVGMDRFRPNIVVRGWGPFVEDDWTEIRVGGINLHTPKACSRCRIPGIDQRTLEVKEEPTKTLKTFRAGTHVPQWKETCAKDVFFGMNVLHESVGVLRVGDKVEALRVAREIPAKTAQ